MLDWFLYRAPTSSYDDDSFDQELLYLPDELESGGPAFYCSKRDPVTGGVLVPNMIVIILHGNAMDIGHIAVECQLLADELNCTVVAPEYPGYGLHSDPSTTKDGIDTAAWNAFRFVVDTVRCPPQRILVYGRSIGTGVAATLARRAARAGKPVGGLILLSPYTSILAVVEDQVGFVSKLFDERWRPEDDLPHANCPMLLLHGCKDTLIEAGHTRRLWRRLGGSGELPADRIASTTRAAGPVWVRLSADADHNQWEYDDDILTPIRVFVDQCVVQSTDYRRAAPPAAFDQTPYLFASRVQGKTLNSSIACIPSHR